MGKRVRFWLAGGVLSAILCMWYMMALAAETPTIEQVYVNLPEVTVYGTNWPEGKLEAYLGQKGLSYKGKRSFGETGEPVYYYILLDISNSMPDSYFQALKQSIAGFEEHLRTQDRMALYTFGEHVELRLTENHSSLDMESVLESVENTDNRTLLFEAIRAAAERADQIDPEVCRRKVLLVVSDGEDFNIGSTGETEARDSLKKAGIPVYAFAIKDTARENINSFGEFARTSGGTLTIFDAQQAGTVFDTFPEYMAASDVLEWNAGSNQVTNRLETFTMRTASGQTVSREVMVSRHIKDLDSPELTVVDCLKKDQIAIEFSERVTGAEIPSHYVVLRHDDKKKKDKAGEKDDNQKADETDARDTEEGVIVTVLSVSTDKENDNRMILSFPDELKAGRYTISCTDIFDISMEENAVRNELEFVIDQKPLMERVLTGIKGWYWIGIILAVLILVIVLLRGYQKVKKGHGVVYLDGKPVMASEIELHKHISIQEKKGKEFYLRVSVKGKCPEDMTLYLNESFIVGRSQICNLYFDDKRMSRQHFALEWDGEHMYVMDLDTTNGTMVNKVPIHQRRRLQQNDVISAGSVELTIRW